MGHENRLNARRTGYHLLVISNTKFNEINEFPAINKINKKGYKSDGQNFNRITMFLKEDEGEW